MEALLFVLQMRTATGFDHAKTWNIRNVTGRRIALLAAAEYDVIEEYEEYMFDGIANVRMAREWLTESARQETAQGIRSL